MNREEKKQFVSDMKARLEKAQGTYLIDYQGLDVASMNSLSFFQNCFRAKSPEVI